MSFHLVVSKAQLETFQRGLSMLPENDVIETEFGFDITVASLMELVDLTLDSGAPEDTVHHFVL